MARAGRTALRTSLGPQAGFVSRVARPSGKIATMSTTTIAASRFAGEIARCRSQQRLWSLQTVRQRLGPVRAFRRLLVEECDRLAAAVTSDMGKLPEEALAGDVVPLADACRFLERQAAGLLRPRSVPLRQRPLWLWGQRDTVYRRPRGMVGIIGTWNYPLFLNGVQLLQALTAGNGVLWKPSEVTPASAEALFALMVRAGFPDGLVQLLPVTREAGQALASADVDHIVFT